MLPIQMSIMLKFKYYRVTCSVKKNNLIIESCPNIQTIFTNDIYGIVGEYHRFWNGWETFGT
jgi:hypothetical protein